MAFTFKLETAEGASADPPTYVTAVASYSALREPMVARSGQLPGERRLRRLRRTA